MSNTVPNTTILIPILSNYSEPTPSADQEAASTEGLPEEQPVGSQTCDENEGTEAEMQQGPMDVLFAAYQTAMLDGPAQEP